MTPTGRRDIEMRMMCDFQPTLNSCEMGQLVDASSCDREGRSETVINIKCSPVSGRKNPNRGQCKSIWMCNKPGYEGSTSLHREGKLEPKEKKDILP